MTIGRFQPFTQGHLNMINEGDGPCIVYRINSSDKKIERKRKGIKIGSKSYTDESVNKVIEYIDNPTGDLNEQEKELLKRPFTNELIDKELEIVKKSNKNIIDVIPVVNMFEALARFNKFILDHQDKYEPQYWMCGDDRVDNYSELIDKYDKLAIERGGEEYDNVVKGKLKTSTGKGRTEGVSGTAVRKAILTKDKSAFEKIMPKGTGSMFNDFIKAFDDFKVQLQGFVKECKMLPLKDYIIQESLKDKIKGWINKFKKEKVPEKVYKKEDLLEYKDKEITLDDGDEIFDIYTNTLPYKSSRTSEFEKNAFKQGLYNYAWCNYSREVDKNFRFNEFGDEFADWGYSRANDESGYDWNEVGVGMMFMEPFFWGWKCAKKLNLKYNSRDKVKLPLNRFAK
jgi:hypothetical protein